MGTGRQLPAPEVIVGRGETAHPAMDVAPGSRVLASMLAPASALPFRAILIVWSNQSVGEGQRSRHS